MTPRHQLNRVSLLMAVAIFAFLPIFTNSQAVGFKNQCPRLLPRKGVDLSCSVNGTTIPCHHGRPPLNTVAKFNCKPYFESEHGSNGGSMKCNKKGRWRNIPHYRNFKCHLTAGGWISQVIDHNRVVMFSLSYCGYCHKLKQIFSDFKIKYFAIEVDLVDYKRSTLLKEALYRRTGMRTYPNVFINRKHIGGYDKTYSLYHYGTLQQLVNEPAPLT